MSLKIEFHVVLQNTKTNNESDQTINILKKERKKRIYGIPMFLKWMFMY